MLSTETSPKKAHFSFRSAYTYKINLALRSRPPLHLQRLSNPEVGPHPVSTNPVSTRGRVGFLRQHYGPDSGETPENLFHNRGINILQSVYLALAWNWYTLEAQASAMALYGGGGLVTKSTVAAAKGKAIAGVVAVEEVGIGAGSGIWIWNMRWDF